MTRDMVGVYGATGFLGRLVTERLGSLGATSVLIGRDRDAVERLAASHGTARAAVAPIDDAAALARALEGCGVLINCVPPSIAGHRLVRAALDASVHYVDAGGEQRQISSLFDTFDADATARRLTVVPALGFDYAIGDCLARLVARGCEPLTEIVIAYCLDGSDVVSNSAHAAVTTAGGQEVVYRDRGWRAVPFEWDRASFVFPPPIGRRQMSRYGSGEVVTVPRHTDTAAVRTLIISAALCPYPALLPVFPILRPLVGWARTTPLRRLLALAARVSTGVTPDATPASQAVHAQAPDERRFVIAVEAHGANGLTGRGVASGGSFHAVTAALLAQGALWLIGGSAPVGVHSPATAFAPAILLDALAPLGVTWTVE